MPLCWWERIAPDQLSSELVEGQMADVAVAPAAYYLEHLLLVWMVTVSTAAPFAHQ